MRRLGLRAAILAVIAATAVVIRLVTLPQPPVPREILVGGTAVVLAVLAIIGGFAIAEARAMSRAEERMRRFLADASHELRTPIAGAHASAETLLRTNPGPAARERLVLAILGETHRAGQLVSDLLAITRLEQGLPVASEPVDLVPLATAAVERARELAPSLLVKLNALGPVSLAGDPRSIAQALDNLLSNARHATPPGGRVTVSITTEPEHVVVEVTDTGPGIPVADRERVFDRFTRLPETYPGQPGGSGLGLAIARGIAAAHRGTLSCADPAGESGARFLLRLPRPRDGARPPRIPRAGPPRAAAAHEAARAVFRTSGRRGG